MQELAAAVCEQTVFGAVSLLDVCSLAFGTWLLPFYEVPTSPVSCYWLEATPTAQRLHPRNIPNKIIKAESRVSVDQKNARPG